MTKHDLIDIIKDLKNHLPIDIACRALRKKVEIELNNAIVDEINRKFNPSIFAKMGWSCKNPVSYSHIRKRSSIDAAVFKNENVLISLMEMKAHNTINFPWWLISHYKGKDYPMIYDILKMIENAHVDTDLYYIFFNNVVKSSVPLPPNPKSGKFFGYTDLLAPHFTLPYKDKVLMVFKNWAYLLQQLGLPLNLTTAVEIVAGSSHGFPVSIIAFVYGPFTKENRDVLGSQVQNLPFEPFKDPKFWIKEPYENLLKRVKLDGIEFYYEDDLLKDLADDGVICKRIPLP